MANDQGRADAEREVEELKAEVERLRKEAETQGRLRTAEHRDVQTQRTRAEAAEAEAQRLRTRAERAEAELMQKHREAEALRVSNDKLTVTDAYIADLQEAERHHYQRMLKVEVENRKLRVTVWRLRKAWESARRGRRLFRALARGESNRADRLAEQVERVRNEIADADWDTPIPAGWIRDALNGEEVDGAAT